MATRPAVAEFLRALDETQYLSPLRLQVYQRRLLAGLLDHARRETAFYAERLDPVMRADGSFDWERWPELPILTRSEAQDNFDALCARSLPPVAGSAQEDTSSGSTGRPLRHMTTEIQNLASGCASERFFTWHNIDPGSLTVRIRAAKHPDTAYPKGRRTASWRAGYPDSEAIDLSISTPGGSSDRMAAACAAEIPRHLPEQSARDRPRGSALRHGAALRCDHDL